jgi:hypothetical protein
MKRILLLTLASTIIAVGYLTDAPRARAVYPATTGAVCDCVEITRVRGDNCGSPNSLRIEYRNMCTYAVNAQIYIRRSPDSERERVGTRVTMRPEERSSYFWCKEPYQADVDCE